MKNRKSCCRIGKNKRISEKQPAPVTRALAFALLMLLMAGALAGCGKKGESATRIILTTGFGKNEIFRIDSASCKKYEVMIYLTNTQNQYEGAFGREIWQKDFGGVTLEENVKEIVLARIARVKTMTLLAKENSVKLSKEETALCREAAERYYGSLNSRERALLEADEDEIASMYEDYALADKVYHYIIRDINPEISDDEARTITLQHILLRTHTGNEQGGRMPLSEEEKAYRHALAKKLCERLEQGEDFESLMQLYNEAEENTLYIRHGETEKAFEDAAFSLESGEVSGIVETSDGYEIIRCVSTFDRKQTDANKIEIVRERREQVFSGQYESFVSGLTKQLNEKLWKEIALIRDQEVKTADFFDVYSEIFENVSFY